MTFDILDPVIQQFLEGRRWVFIKEDGILHSMSKEGEFLCGVKSDTYRNGRFLEDYEMCTECVSKHPVEMQEYLVKESKGIREWAMKNDDLPDEIFDMKPNELVDKLEDDLG